MSVYTTGAVNIGGRYVALTPDQTARLKNYLIFLGLHDPILPNRYYGLVNDDTYLADLLGLHPDRDGKAISALAKIYGDAGNVAPEVVNGYSSLLLRDIAAKNLTVYNAQGEPDEALTESIRMLLQGLDTAGLEAMMASVIEGGLVYGDMFIALYRDAQGHIWGYCKEAPAVFPVVNYSEPTVYAVNFSEYESGRATLVRWSELYAIGRTEVWKDSQIVPTMSGETNIDEPAMAWAPLLPSRGELWGRSVIAGIAETIVTYCGLLGSTVRSIRQDVAGITIFSGSSASEAVSKTLGVDPNKKNRAARVDAFSPDNPVIIAGEEVTGQRLDSNTGQNVTPFAELLDKDLRDKCAIYAMKMLGANASGRAIELTMMQLQAEVTRMRSGVERLWTNVARIGTKLQGQEWPEGYTVKATWGDVFPEAKEAKLTRLTVMLEKGIVGIDYVVRELGLDGDELVKAHLAAAAAKAAQPVQTAGPFEGLMES